jgi:hypothetical protein
MLSKMLLGISAIAIFAVLIYILVNSCKGNTEGWVNYKQQPFGNIYTGSGDVGVRPVGFYDVPRFRRPYNWPVTHLVDYPVPHSQHDP